MYKTTSPKLKTSDLNALFPTILVPLILTSSGARKGTVPRMVAYSRLYFETILLLPTSHNLILRFLLSIIKIFSGLISQCARLIYSSDAKAAKI